MINQQLSQVQPATDHISLPEIVEAFAFTYLAGYNNASIEPRVNQAFGKAYNPTQIINIPRVNGGMPGGTVAMWTQQATVRMLVAVEGVFGLNQLGGLLDAIMGTNYHGMFGQVAAIYSDYADAFRARLEANPIINQFLTQRPHLVTFCGHSMGAAMAELMAAKLKRELPSKTIRLIKFGAPRVGTSVWQRSNLANIKRIGVYNENDPIHHFPFVARQTLLGSVMNGLRPLTTYERDDAIFRFRVREGIARNYLSERIGATVRHASAYIGDPLVANYWQDHRLDSYRLTFMNYAAGNPDLIAWRFNGLEFNDENSWQVLFRPRIALSAMSKVVLDPAPDPIGPPAAAAAAQAQDVEVIPDNFLWGRDADGDAENVGRNWGGPPVLETQSRPQRHIRRR